MLGAWPIVSPMDQKIKLTKIDYPLLDDLTVYRKLAGRLLYLTITWLDLAYSAQVVIQFTDQPQKPPLDVAYKVLWYIKGTIGQGVFYSTSS